MTSKVQQSIKALNEHALHAIACGLAWANVTLDDMRRLQDEGLTLDTIAGPAFFRFYPAERTGRTGYLNPWLHVRFQDVDRAKNNPAVGQQRLNPYSGKYNFMGLDVRGSMGCETELRWLSPATKIPPRMAA